MCSALYLNVFEDTARLCASRRISGRFKRVTQSILLSKIIASSFREEAEP
jgi:hypothetical protein